MIQVSKSELQNVPLLNISLGIPHRWEHGGDSSWGAGERLSSKADPIPLVSKYTATGLIKESLTVSKTKKIVEKKIRKAWEIADTQTQL